MVTRETASLAGHNAHTALNIAGSSGITVFDVPGAATASQCASFDLFNDCGTLSFGANAPGSNVGTYLSSAAVPTAFIRTQGGSYTSFQAPGAGTGSFLEQGTVAFGITNGGVIAGQYLDAQFVYHGFVRQTDGSFLTYDAPFASQIPNDNPNQGTFPTNINAVGDTAGVYYDVRGFSHGFIRYRNGSFVQILPTGSVASSTCIVDCLNNAGTVAGTYFGSDGFHHAYIRSATGTITTVVDTSSTVDTFGAGINNGNKMTGYYIDSNGVSWSFIREQNGKTLTFQEPNASVAPNNGTQTGGINDAGAVTGIYADASGVVHGFWRSQGGRFEEFDPNGSVETLPFFINASGQVTGQWYDALGQVHGFIWMSH